MFFQPEDVDEIEDAADGINAFLDENVGEPLAFKQFEKKEAKPY